ncbi:MAG: cytochrome c [Pseudomonadota bacterium]
MTRSTFPGLRHPRRSPVYPSPLQSLGARWTASASALTLLLAAPGSLAERTIEDAVFSKSQARAGKKLYDQHCIACHERGYFREVLRTRRGETLDPLFEVMVTEMPQNDPGSLTDQEYVDVIAYMLSQSRYAVGEEPLKANELSEISIPGGG